MIEVRRRAPGSYWTADGRFEVRRDREPSYRPLVIDGVEIRRGRAQRWWSVRDHDHASGSFFMVEDGLSTMVDAIEALTDWIENWNAGAR